MPELPEVETIARGLANAVTTKTIASVEVRFPKVVTGISPDALDARLRGRRITQVGRRGKYVVLRLDDRLRLVISLRMTGRLIVQPAGTTEAHPYTHVLFTFSDGTRLCFADVRQFGRVRVVDENERWDEELGLEPLSEAFTTEAFVSMLDGRRTPVKSLLLDQQRIAGIGNIYACEALWRSRIRPSTPAGRLSRPAARRLHAAIRDVLSEAVDMRGTSVDDYVDADGLRGGFQNRLSVYGRAGDPCPRCNAPLVRTVLTGRGTWWCRSCQRR